MDNSMAGRVCLVTGGARGMGRVTAMALASMGAQVIVVDWEGEEGTRTRDLINAASGRDAAEFRYCDISSLDDVRRLAAEVQTAWPALHVLVNNAGITDPVRRLSVDGWEMHLATCHLGHFLLTQLLLDMLERSAPARIVNISSDAHKAGKGLDFDDINNEKIWGGRRVSNNAAFVAYHRAKLCNVYFTLEMAERLDGTGVSTYAVSPGYFVNTTIYRNISGLFRIGAGVVFGVGTLLGLNTPEKGARTQIYCAADRGLETLSGRYWSGCRDVPLSALARDADARARLWAFSVEATIA
ncbi:MAG: SDR family NAD(P)-dependent oxidoreductase [Chromatiales bacterium]|nr:SDR family NAD(P)-dependent oxidoreductase [Chromatiales bacterium]